MQPTRPEQREPDPPSTPWRSLERLVGALQQTELADWLARARALAVSGIRRSAMVLLLGPSLATGLYLLETAWSTGEIRILEPHFLGECRSVTGLIGGEDITIHPRTGVAYISAYDRRADAMGLPIRGSIYAYRPASEPPKLVDLAADLPGSFRPHGIDLFANPEVERWKRLDPSKREGPPPRDSIFVVNHADGGHSIEIFDLVGRHVEARKTIRDPLLLSPNDLVAVDADRFYVTNDTGTRRGEWAWVLENFLRFPYSNVLYYDGKRLRPVATRIAKAGGINLSPDGRKLYVAALMSGELLVYDRDPKTGSLELESRVALGTSPDSVEVDAAGYLWVGAHPKLLTLVRHLLFGGPGEREPLRASSWSMSVRAPSQVLRLHEEAGGQYQLNEIYLDDGDEITAATVGARYFDHLLIGSLTDAKILDCRLDPHPKLDYKGQLEPR